MLVGSLFVLGNDYNQSTDFVRVFILLDALGSGFVVKIRHFWGDLFGLNQKQLPKIGIAHV